MRWESLSLRGELGAGGWGNGVQEAATVRQRRGWGKHPTVATPFGSLIDRTRVHQQAQLYTLPMRSLHPSPAASYAAASSASLKSSANFSAVLITTSSSTEVSGEPLLIASACAVRVVFLIERPARGEEAVSLLSARRSRKGGISSAAQRAGEGQHSFSPLNPVLAAKRSR